MPFAGDTLSQAANTGGAISAGTALVTIPAPAAGYYRVKMYFYTSGTVTGADNDNVQLTIGGVFRETVLAGSSGVAGAGTAQVSGYWADGKSDFVLAVVAASSGACVYHVKLSMALAPVGSV